MQYTDSHEWVAFLQGKARVGISSYGQKEVGEIVYVQLPTAGKAVRQGDVVAILESTKAAIDIYSPIGGTILSVNTVLAVDTSSLNRDPESSGWLFEIATDAASLSGNFLSVEEYEQLTSSEKE